MTLFGHVSLPLAPLEALPPLVAALLYAKRAATLAARGTGPSGCSCVSGLPTWKKWRLSVRCW